MPTTVLDRELYDIKLAAHVLKMPPSTLQWWLDGGQRNGRHYPPVIRQDRIGSKTVTWGELVEARYLLGYRRELRVALGQLRTWIERVREVFDVPYPLAHRQPWIGDRSIITDAQMSAGLPEELWAMWRAESGQILLLPPGEAFLEKIEFDEDEVVRIRPAGKESPIVIDPQVRFGMASVHGIPTEAITEQIEAGDPVEMVAADFNLELAEVAEVLAYELRAPTPVAA
jgi:uncharacterized protein (DUF433 family)